MNNKKPTFKERLKKTPLQWTKAIISCFVYLLFIVWLDNYKWLLLLPFIFDIFITQFIPWYWWKKSKIKAVKVVMGWIDAIVFALVAVYLINNFLFQNYQIPTSSLEKTLLVGDFLAVSKVAYGPRIPMTPFSFPLVQNTLPIFNSNSYLEKPQWKYRRLKGWGTVKREDIVVFNFPAGDTIAFKKQNPDYYTSCYREGFAYMVNVLQQKPTRELCYKYGKEIVESKPSIYGEIMYRPVDRRENYVKRCVGLPGDSLQIIDNQVFINGKILKNHKGVQFNYFVQTDGVRISKATKDKLGISDDDFMALNDQGYQNLIQSLGLDPDYPIYHFPLTAEAHKILSETKGITKIIIEPDWVSSMIENDDVYPLGGGNGWTRDNYGPIYIPKKGTTITLNSQTYPIYERIIRSYEANSVIKIGENYIINGEQTNTYTFQMDYYWMMGDNRHNSLDSRMWGFVPENHIVGRPMFVWLSLNKDKGWFDGKIRFDRFFKSAKQ